MQSNYRANLLYAAVQALYWICYCPIVGFISSYLLGLGYGSVHVGAVLALANITSLIVQPMLSERSDADPLFSPLHVVTGLVSVIFAGSIVQVILAPRGIVLLALCTLSAACIISSCAFVTSVKFQLADDDAIDFGFCRAIGSLAWALVSVPLGFAIERIGAAAVPVTAAVSAAVLLALLQLCEKLAREEGRGVLARAGSPRGDAKDWGAFARDNRWLMMLLLGTSLVYLHHSLSNNFSILLVENVGGDNSDMGFLIALAAVCELPAMMLFSRISKRFRAQALVAFSLVMFAAKALAIWLASSVGLLMGAFSLQLVSFAVFTPATVAYAQVIVDARDQVKAQTCFTLVTTLAAIFSSLVGGALFQSFGVHTTLMLTVIAAVIGVVISCASMAHIKVRA